MTEEKAPQLIKKYGNRRLYHTGTSSYLSLQQLADLIRSGQEVKVVEAATGRDITRQVLCQVILESDSRLELLPVELLTLIIRSQGTLEQVPLAVFLQAAARQFLSAGAAWAKQFASMFGLEQPPAAAPSAEKNMNELRQRVDRLLENLSRQDR